MKKAFTLAETLIVIAIIGVIATLTLPNVMANYKKKVYVAQLQKVYNQIENAMQQFLADENAEKISETYFGDDVSSDVNSSNIIKFLKKYFKTTKTCYPRELDQCLSSFKNFEGNDTITIDTSYKYYPNTCAVLNTGSVICISTDFADGAHSYLETIVDINGKEGPNQIGRDVFYMEVYSNGVKSKFYYDENDNIFRGCDRGWADGYTDGCLGRIQAAGWKMDY